MTWAILATGPSMSQSVADSVRGRFPVVAVSDAYKLAPWAEALVSQDPQWWKHHTEAQRFAGRKFSGRLVSGVEPVSFSPGLHSASNSGLLAISVAAEVFKAKKIVLLGFDMCGSHFFGAHPAPLKNTNALRFESFQVQFERYRPAGVEILNCSPKSALRAYPRGRLGEILMESHT